MRASQDPPFVATQITPFPNAPLFLPSLAEYLVTREPFAMGPNDSSIKRGDREDTGDNEAQPDEMGSGDVQPTVDPTSFGGVTSIRHPSSDRFDPQAELQDVDGMETMLPTDGRLGLTDVGDVPADDWAAGHGSNQNRRRRR